MVLFCHSDMHAKVWVFVLPSHLTVSFYPFAARVAPKSFTCVFLSQSQKKALSNEATLCDSPVPHPSRATCCGC
jgi:hypothetical protein